MGNVKDYFSGNFLKAEDSQGGEIVEILAAGYFESIETGDHEKKQVLNYKVSVNGAEKIFTPNKSNGNIMIEAWGVNDDQWIGKKFYIRIETIRAFGKKMKSIIVEPIVEEKVAKK